MVDQISQEQRSQLMSRVRGVDTKPEMLVRRLVHSMGYRYRLHRRDLPGNPDLVFPSRKKVIFVHGCFWHQHPGCSRTKRPSTRKEFWNAKLDGNVKRDKKVQQQLAELGWKVLIVWQCETRDADGLVSMLLDFLVAD